MGHHGCGGVVMRWRSIVSSWASRRYRGRHRTGIPFAQVAARINPQPVMLAERLRDLASALGSWRELDDQPPGDECVTQIIPTPNVVRRADTLDVPTVEFARVPAWTVRI